MPGKANYKLTDKPFLFSDNGDLLGIVGRNGVTNILPAMQTDNAITALAGGGQSTSLQNYRHLRVTTVVTAADSITLPKALAGMSMSVTNAAAANSMTVFPALGEFINALAVNTGLAQAANKATLFVCSVNGTWNSNLTA